MKNLKYIFLLLICLAVGVINVEAKENELYNLDIKVHINKDASAHITETWYMNLEKDTEVYKPMGNLTYSTLTNFKVTDERGVMYTYNNTWNINDTFQEKAYKNGLYSGDSGIELCWGISSYGSHAYTIEYDITNFVMKVADGQIIYWKLVNDAMNPSPKKAKVEISSDIVFEDTVPVWGLGYEGTAFVKDGKIHLESKSSISSNDYMVLYANFEPNTFDASIELDGTRKSWLFKAKYGTIIKKVVVLVIIALIISIIVFLLSKLSSKLKGPVFGIKCNKIDNKNLEYCRELSSDDGISRIYFISKIYHLIENDSDFIGAILLKWLHENKISITDILSKNPNKTEKAIDLKKNEDKNFTTSYEKTLYQMLYIASYNGILSNRELKSWASKNKNDVSSLFGSIIAQEKGKLIVEGKLIEKKSTSKLSSKKYSTHNNLDEEAYKIAGLKKFLIDFSDMKNKEVIDVHLWEEYLIYAQIFGIAKKVRKQAKQMYPDLSIDIDFDSIEILGNVILNGVKISTSLVNSAINYETLDTVLKGINSIKIAGSTGGGGFSSGGGGGGSFGGGSGGGCR